MDIDGGRVEMGCVERGKRGGGLLLLTRQTNYHRFHLYHLHYYYLRGMFQQAKTTLLTFLKFKLLKQFVRPSVRPSVCPSVRLSVMLVPFSLKTKGIE